uniref:Uncharacterized protein n=1 Tax=Arundo donax TaxID=35708 RepID=A0A0A9FYW5_ARUDO
MAKERAGGQHELVLQGRMLQVVEAPHKTAS